MVRQILEKWFGLPPEGNEVVEILRMQLAESNAERRELLKLLLERGKPEPPEKLDESTEPIRMGVNHVPWRVRQQMLEAEDRQQAKNLRDRKKEIADLEKELDIAHVVDRGPSGGLEFVEKKDAS